MKPHLGQKLKISIQRLGIHGEGIGESQGLTTFVDGALPGEDVTASVVEVRKNFARAKVEAFETLSPYRVAPPCPVFGKCGGCQLQHLDYAHQLATKRQRVIDAFERIGKLFDIPVSECVPSPYPFAYRNKIQLPVVADSDLRLGLYAFNSHDIIEIDKCYIHCDLGEEAFHRIRRLLKTVPEIWPTLRHVLVKTGISTRQVLVILVTDGEGSPFLTSVASQIIEALPEIRGVVQNINTSPGNVILSSKYRTLAGQPFIEDLICGLRFKVSPASFFQVNPQQAEKLYQQALSFAELQGHETVLDAYCGVGTLSLIFAQHTLKVIGVESVPAAIEDANENAQLNHIKNASFVCAKAEDYIAKLKGIDTAVLNPPRKGCDPQFLEVLAKIQPKKLVYISCDPATLARDLAILKSKGYAIDQAVPFDMFPQTMHVECVVQLSNQHKNA
jgi:23S rRNA (uracil1939-C5)-methyltransferase